MCEHLSPGSVGLTTWPDLGRLKRRALSSELHEMTWGKTVGPNSLDTLANAVQYVQ